MTRKIWMLVAILLATFLLIVNFQKAPTEEVAKAVDRPITIGYSSWAGWWPWAIAEQEGLFTKHDLSVELKWFDDYSDSLKELEAGAIDGNSQTLNDTISFAGNAVKGEVVVLVNDNSAGNDKIIAANGINSIKELKGKKVLLEPGVVDDYLLSLALQREGLSRNDVEILGLETGAATAAFKAGAGDAVAAFPPFWLEAFERKGAKEIASSREFPGAIPDLLVVTQEMVDEYPDKVQALIDTWFDILKFMASNSQKADEIIANRAQVNSEDLQLFKKGVQIFSLEDNLEAFSKGNEMKFMPYAAREISDFLEDNLKSFEKKPNLKKMFNDNFVKSFAS